MHADAPPVIGLEIHAQLRTRTKLFCACPASYGDPPNRNTCPVCLAHPGALPTLNAAAVSLAVKAALALSFQVRTESVFERKHYFYPDLPKGYQITQYGRPLAEGGSLQAGALPGDPPVPLARLHLEEDAGKTYHDPPGRRALIDFNRAGVPLVEIVTEPVLASPEEAVALLRHLRRVLVHLGVCTGRMEEGSLRCDANISLRGPSGEPGPKVEVKNLNSFRFVERALRHEIARQREVLAGGGTVASETRLFEEAGSTTAPMRSKEEGRDYRYFPEPDLPPLRLSREFVDLVRGELPDLPASLAGRLVEEGLSPKEAEVLVDDPALLAYFRPVASGCGSARAAANWVLGEGLRAAKELEKGLEGLRDRVPPQALAGLANKVASGELTATSAKEVFAEMVASGEGPGEVARRLGADVRPGDEEVARAVEEALAEHPAAAQEWLSGREKAFGFLVGAVMRRTGGRAEPGLVHGLLRARLESMRG